MSTPRKAIALISGGLDSLLAAKLMLDQGIHIEGINFFTGFCVEGHTHAIRSKDRKKAKRNNALWVAETLGIKLHIIDVIEEYKDVVINPKHGYGANLNPCLDCKSFMVKKAREWIVQHDFDFIVTGEVMGQRPMSQRRETMPIVAQESGANDLLLRPLCAKRLNPTLAEREGWVDRDKLMDITGRSRKPQMALAQQFGIEGYAQPAGGCCFLTDAQYSHKLADLWSSRGNKQYDLDDIMLLKVGRHIRPDKSYKLIVGRDEGENKYLQGYRSRFIHLMADTLKGPLVLVHGDTDTADLQLAARITARYSQGRDREQVDVRITNPDGNAEVITVTPLPPNDIPQAWLL